MAKNTTIKQERINQAARDVTARVLDWLIDDDGAHWRQDVSGADFVAAMTREIEHYRRAVGLPAVTDR